VAGLEESCVVERKGLPDLIDSVNAERSFWAL
jgi:ERCC4-type nuclease